MPEPSCRSTAPSRRQLRSPGAGRRRRPRCAVLPFAAATASAWPGIESLARGVPGRLLAGRPASRGGGGAHLADDAGPRGLEPANGCSVLLRDNGGRKRRRPNLRNPDRKAVEWGKGGAVRVRRGGSGVLRNK